MSFLSDSSTDIYKTSDGLGISVQGQQEASITANATHILNDIRGTGNVVASRVLASTSGNVSAPSFAFQEAPNMGFHTTSNNSSIGVSILGTTLGVLGNTAWSINPQLRTSDQSASFPSYSFINDTNTGFYHTGNDRIGVSTGGNLRMTIGSSNVSSTIPIAVQPVTANQGAIVRLKADSGTSNLLQELNMETPGSGRGSGISFIEAGNSNVQTFIGRAYMVGSPISATRIIAQQDAGNSPVSVFEGRSGGGVTNRNLVLTVQDDGRTALGEGNYFPLGMLDIAH